MGTEGCRRTDGARRARMEENRRMILAGEIGATRTRLAAFETQGNKLQQVVEKIYMSQEHSGLPEIISDFIRTEGIPVQSACFGVAGPVRAGRSKISNLPWIIDSRELTRQLKLNSVGLINDLEAYAYGIDALESKDFIALSEGSEDAEGNRAVISARTGLGVAGLYWDGFRHHPFACEGGHTDFAPRNELEMDLLRYLRGKFGHVSYERIVSGPGLVNVFHFLRDTGRGREPQWLIDEMSQSDPAAAISRSGVQGKCPLCEQAVDLFVSIYGAEAGNLALKLLATGGIYVGGGIAPRILEKLQAGPFLEALDAKGRFSELLSRIPVHVILNDRTALLGAARLARGEEPGLHHS